MSEARWDIPETWVWSSVADFAKVVGGGTPSSQVEGNFAENGIPWITPADLTGYRLSHISRGRRDLSKEGFASCGAQMIPAGSVLFSSRAPIGYCVIASNELTTNQGFKSLVLHGNIVPEYIRYYLISAKDYAESRASGTTFMELSGARVAELSIPLAPIPEQKRIVAKVDGLTARTARARADLDRIPTLIARYKQRLLALAFSGELTAAWRVERRISDPKPMSLAKLSEGLRYGTAQKSYEEPKGIAVLRIPNVVSGRISLDDLKYSELESKEIEKLALRDGDILVVRSNGSAELVGRPALVSDEAAGMAYAGYLIRIRPNPNLVSPQFLTFMLEAPAIRRVIEQGARSTSGVHNVNAKELGALQIPIFHRQEQAEITHRIASAFAWLERISADHTAATKLLPKLDVAILGKAFRGELVPQDPIDEPAHVLLKRIQAEHEIMQKAKQVRKAFARKEHAAMRRTLEDVLSEVADWLPAQEAFRRCGMPENADTKTIEDLYSELRILDKAGRLEVKPITDDQGRKLFDHLKLKA